MLRDMLINLSLTPVFEYDSEIDNFLVYYKEFPQAFASGKTEEEAENKLIPLIELMWEEQPEDLKNILMEKYLNQNKNIAPKVRKHQLA